MLRSSDPTGMPWNAALSSAERAISVRTTVNGMPAASSASIAGVRGSSVMRLGPRQERQSRAATIVSDGDRGRMGRSAARE